MLSKMQEICDQFLVFLKFFQLVFVNFFPVFVLNIIGSGNEQLLLPVVVVMPKYSNL